MICLAKTDQKYLLSWMDASQSLQKIERKKLTSRFSNKMSYLLSSQLCKARDFSSFLQICVLSVRGENLVLSDAQKSVV